MSKAKAAMVREALGIGPPVRPRRQERPRCAPGIYTAGRHGAWAECGCGWRGPVVAGGAIGASVAWAMHVAELVSDRRGRRKGG